MTKKIIFLLILIMAVLFISHKMNQLILSKEIVKFELIVSEKALLKLISKPEWTRITANNQNKLDRLRIHTFWDFAYILAYSSFFILLAKVFIGKQKVVFESCKNKIIAAGVCDVFENLCILKITHGSYGFLVPLMSIFAFVKFSLLLWVLCQLIFSIFKTKATK